MALIFFDGFDAGDYGIGKWSSHTNGTNTTTTRYGVGRAGSHTNTGNFTESFTAVSQVFVGFAYAHTAQHAADFLSLHGDSGATSHLTLRWSSAGTLALYRGGSTLLATASSSVTDPLFGSGAWHYIEVSATIADSGGTCVVKCDGVTLINFTGDTKNAGTNTTIDTVKLLRSVTQTYFDDVYILDATGSAPHNSFLGEIRVYTLSPSGAGASTQWTPSTGSNYATVDELPYSASDNVQSSVSGNRDTYAMGNLPSNVGTIYALQTCLVAKKSDAGAMSVKVVDRPGSTNYASSAVALGTADSTVIGPTRTTNPDTSAAWTASDVNALEAGVEVA